MFPDPVNILGVPLHPFGIIAALSLLLGYGVTAREMKRLKLPVDRLPDFAFDIMIPAFLGARIAFILRFWPHYIPFSTGIFKFWEGGLVLYGGLLGGFLGGLWFCRKNKLSVPLISDSVAPGLCLGLAVSRLGCLAAGCCFGKPTSLPWGIIFYSPESLARPLEAPLHPTQVYSFLAGMAIFAYLLSIRKKKTYDGEIFLNYLFLESGLRPFIEIFRNDASIFMIFTALSLCTFSAFWIFQRKIQARGETSMVKPNFKLPILLIAAVFFTACGIIRTQQVTRGIDIRESDVNQIQKGTSTEKNILKLFGAPTKWRDTTEGKELFYEYAQAGGPQWNLLVSVGGGTATKTLLVWLNKEGIVTDYAYKTS